MPSIKTIVGTDLLKWEEEVNKEYASGKWKFIQTHFISTDGIITKYIAVLVSAN